MIPKKAKDASWRVVRDCLTKFHHRPATWAKRKADRRRREVESRPTARARNHFYHHEAFDVACDIAENCLDITQFREEYHQILDANHPLPSHK